MMSYSRGARLVNSTILVLPMMVSGWSTRSWATVGRAAPWSSLSIGQWTLGDHTWEPLANCKELQVLDNYLVLMGVEHWRALPR